MNFNSEVFPDSEISPFELAPTRQDVIFSFEVSKFDNDWSVFVRCEFSNPVRTLDTIGIKLKA